MAELSSKSLQLQGWIDRLRGGDDAARGELLNSACERLRLITRKMLRRYPRVKRWEQTDDVLQNASLRLYRTLEQVTPESVRDFLRLASLNIRRELLDLVKHYYGPRGHGAAHATMSDRSDSDTRSGEPSEAAALTHEPSRLAAWTDLHRAVEALPEEEREVFDLLWYQGISQVEAAALLGVSDRTIKRRWQSARLKLVDALHGQLPPED
jgi:RNA polymerase sigma-70 factor (ECF subfamily)